MRNTTKHFGLRPKPFAQFGLSIVLVLALTLMCNLFIETGAVKAAGVTTYTNGSTYLIEKPDNWNGTLLLYSHGYKNPGSSNGPEDVGDPYTGAYLLQQGYALAGSYYGTGWALEQAFPSQIAVLDWFNQNVGHPTRTIAWGHSLGGMITAGLVQKYPDRFDAALPMCGVLGGGAGLWNTGLDAAFVFKTLFAPTNPDLQLVNITNPNNLPTAWALLEAAQATPQGRARLALAAAMNDLPGWIDPASPEPAATDYAAREYYQYLWDREVDFPFAFAFRAELEARAGGNPSWNTGVDYEEQLAKSVNKDEVKALYKVAGLSLEKDLNTLEKAPRIHPNPKAVKYLEKNIVFNGEIDIPVLTMHTTGDGLVQVQNEQSYAQAVRQAGNQHLLRQIYVQRAGHCSFTPAETLAAFKTLEQRLNTGKWDDSTNPAALNSLATMFGPLNTLGSGFVPPAFINYKPAQFLRPYTLVRDKDRDYSEKAA